VARAALAAGAVIVNDVAANRTEDACGALVAEARAGYVAMHMRGTPQTMQKSPYYEDVVAEVNAFFWRSARRSRPFRRGSRAGGARPGHRILERPWGIICSCSGRRGVLQSGSARCCWEFPENPLSDSDRGYPWPNGWRDRGLRGLGGERGAFQIIRTHDVKATVQAVRMVEALRTENSE